MGAIASLFLNVVTGFFNLLILPWHIYNWLSLGTLKEKMNVITLLGMSSEFFYVVLALVLIIIGLGIYKRSILRAVVSVLEQFNGNIGRIAAWFALLMMIQQVMIIVMGQIFRGNV